MKRANCVERLRLVLNSIGTSPQLDDRTKDWSQLFGKRSSKISLLQNFSGTKRKILLYEWGLKITMIALGKSEILRESENLLSRYRVKLGQDDEHFWFSKFPSFSKILNIKFFNFLMFFWHKNSHHEKYSGARPKVKNKKIFR